MKHQPSWVELLPNICIQKSTCEHHRRWINIWFDSKNCLISLLIAIYCLNQSTTYFQHVDLEIDTNEISSYICLFQTYFLWYSRTSSTNILKRPVSIYYWLKIEHNLFFQLLKLIHLVLFYADSISQLFCITCTGSLHQCNSLSGYIDYLSYI